MTLEQAETYLKFALEDAREARTHQAAAHALNRVARLRSQIEVLRRKEG